jgi:FixJ family two-component response regulator
MGKLKPFVVVDDDDESVSRAIKRLLRSIGIASETVVRGDAFLDVLASIPSFQPDCVILDVQMPGLMDSNPSATVRRDHTFHLHYRTRRDQRARACTRTRGGRPSA